MPHRASLSPCDPRVAPISWDLLDRFVPHGPLTPEELDRVVRRFREAVVERAGAAGLTASRDTAATDNRPPTQEASRGRAAVFGPRPIGKPERRFAGMDNKIIALYARGLTVREIQASLARIYGVEVSPDRIGSVTDAAMTGIAAWQSRPLEAMYPVVFFDALRVKIRDGAAAHSKAVYLALAVRPDGTRDILGIWIEQAEGAEFWLQVLTDLRARGCHDILIAVADRLEGMSDALGALFPATTLQTCIVHLIRNSLDYATGKQRRPLAAALRPIYTAESAQAALAVLDAFEHGPWGLRFPTVVAAWRRVWTDVVPFFAFPPEVRRVLYTTNALEGVHACLRKIIKTRGHFPHDDAATELLWLALRRITAQWARPAPSWKSAMNQFAILYGGRFTTGEQ
jgi:putative transposase